MQKTLSCPNLGPGTHSVMTMIFTWRNYPRTQQQSRICCPLLLRRSLAACGFSVKNHLPGVFGPVVLWSLSPRRAPGPWREEGSHLLECSRHNWGTGWGLPIRNCIINQVGSKKKKMESFDFAKNLWKLGLCRQALLLFYLMFDLLRGAHCVG